MTVVLHAHRPGIAAYRSADQSIIAIRNHARHGDLTLDWPLARGLRRNSDHRLHRGVRFHCGLGHERGIRRRCGLRLLGVRELRRKKAERGQNGETIEAKAAREATLTTRQSECRLTNSIA